MIDLRQGDCLELMKDIPDGSIDAIITDPPYGSTSCKWDIIIDFGLMWDQLNRIIKPNGAIALFGSEPFSSYLRISNIKNFKYDWIWNKPRGTGFQIIKYKPLNSFETISIFNTGGKLNYYPVMRPRDESRISKNKGTTKQINVSNGKKYDGIESLNEKYPITSLYFSNENNREKDHPTQKPIELMEYLIKTYSRENETILDFTMGSGSTGIASKNLNRKFIGIEKDDKYFEIAKDRINRNIKISEISPSEKREGQLSLI